MKSKHLVVVVLAMLLAGTGSVWFLSTREPPAARPAVSRMVPQDTVDQKAPGGGEKSSDSTATQTDSAKKSHGAAPKVYELPPELQRGLSLFSLTAGWAVEPAMESALDLTRQESDNLNRKFAAMREHITKWETARAELIPGTNIIMIPPGGAEMQKLVDTLKAEVIAEIGNDRGSFLLLKAEPKLQLQTGLYGSLSKMVRVTFNREGDGSVSTNLPYLVEEKVINSEDLVSKLDWTDPKTFSSASISDHHYSQPFKTIPERYAHLIDPPSDK